MPAVVLDMNDVRPVWSLPDWAVDELRAAFPPDWEVFVAESPAEGTGDGRSAADATVLAAVERAAVYLGFGISADVLRRGRGLRWVHSGSAGVKGSLTPEMLRSSVVFTNSAGIHGPPMAETVLGMILHFARGLDFAVQGKARGEWWQEPFYRADSPVREVAGATVGILGYGGIGREVARRAAPLGMGVLGLGRRPPPEAEETLEPLVPDPGPAGRVEQVHGEAGFSRLLAESDYLVVAAPETPRTRGLLDREALLRMKPGAVLVNVSRGALVDEEALVDALREGRLRGAGLDVFATEPLPAGHPLWSLPNVLVMPHVSPVTRGFWRREVDLIVENARRLQAGEPLLNQVDRQAGY